MERVGLSLENWLETDVVFMRVSQRVDHVQIACGNICHSSSGVGLSKKEMTKNCGKKCISHSREREYSREIEWAVKLYLVILLLFAIAYLHGRMLRI